MNTIESPIPQNLYYTNDHEWIDFQGMVAYTGICHFKLTGFQQIQEIIFNTPPGCRKKGEVIATIKYNDYQVQAHMPVDGKILHINEKLVEGNPNILLDCSENSGWIALIAPSQPTDRAGLLLPRQYRMNHRINFVKQ